ncbi:MAG: glycerophosphodiester phosphodiesterase family protein [Alphaproteobacteria bacterium]|jgi:glycerophosphoryl diester phosphodiesterase
MLCIGHRGGAGLRPENTLEAFRHAVERGCDGAELDIQLTRDGKVVVLHDFTLNPDICRDASGGWLQRASPPVCELTLGELQQFNVGRAKPDSNYAAAHPLVKWSDSARIPTLAQVIDVARAAPRSFQLFVELKTSFLDRNLSATPIALAEAALQVLQEYGYLEHTTLVSFDWPGLLHAKRASAVECWFTTLPHRWSSDGPARPGAIPPPVFTALCSSTWEGTSSWAAGYGTLDCGGWILKMIAEAGGQGWFADYRDLTTETVTHARALGLKIGAWTVNDLDGMRAVQALEPDVICTDRPDLLLAAIKDD